MIRNIPVGLLVFAPDGVIMAASPSAEHMLGLSSEALDHQAWRTLLRPEPANEYFNSSLSDVLEQRRSYRHRLVDYVRPDGEPRRFSLTASCAYNAGKLVAVSLIIDDVSALYQSRRRENSILREKNRLQYDMIESLNNLALSVAHQIRNPVATIGGFAMKLLREHKAQHQSTQYPDIIFQEARRLEEIVAAVVRLASLPPPRLGEVDMAGLVRECMVRAEEAAEAMHKRVEWMLALADGEIVVDRELVRQALHEVLLNAVEFSDQETARVSLTLTRQDDGMLLVVSDEGVGVRDDLRPFVFDPFFTTKARGAGIGLALARKAICEHNGEIDLRPGESGGTVVTVRLFETPEAGLAREGFDGPVGLDVRELKLKARELGIDLAGLTVIDAVRAVQQAEGFSPCFAWGVHDRCGQQLCAFRRECVRTMRIDESPRITYCGACE